LRPLARHIKGFNARLRDELLNGEIFYKLREARIVIESWRRHYNTIRPHASIGYKPPAPSRRGKRPAADVAPITAAIGSLNCGLTGRRWEFSFLMLAAPLYKEKESEQVTYVNGGKTQ
jgi:Integrase core domain